MSWLPDTPWPRRRPPARHREDDTDETPFRPLVQLAQDDARRLFLRIGGPAPPDGLLIGDAVRDPRMFRDDTLVRLYHLAFAVAWSGLHAARLASQHRTEE